MSGSLRIRIEGCRASFAPRARWVLGEFAAALDREAVFTDGEADVVYAPARPAGGGVWIPADDAAQGFFERRDPLPGPVAHPGRGVKLLFPPAPDADAIPGDIVAVKAAARR